MIPPWFRVPVQLIQSEPEEARGWIYLLGQWHIGAAPGHNEIRRALGWGAGRVQRFIPKAVKWALEHGALVPAEVAEHFRSSSGALAEQQRSSIGAPWQALIEDNSGVPEQQRSSSGALAEQQRSDSRARDPFRENKKEIREEIRSEFRASAIPDPTPQVHLFPPITLPPAEAAEASSPVQTPPAIPESPIKPPGAVSGASKTAATAADVKRVWAAYREHHELCKEEPPSGAVQVIKPCLKDFDADQLVAVIHWFHKSEDSTCTFMRGQKLTGIDNILRIKALPGRVEAASKPWRQAQAAGAGPIILDPEGNVIPPKPTEKAAPKGSNDGLAAGVSLWELAEKARATEAQEYNHG